MKLLVLLLLVGCSHSRRVAIPHETQIINIKPQFTPEQEKIIKQSCVQGGSEGWIFIGPDAMVGFGHDCESAFNDWNAEKQSKPLQKG